MNNFFNQAPNENRVRMIAVLENGDQVDEVADVVQTQVIAAKARASIRTRPSVPLYHLVRDRRPPVWQENVKIESGLAVRPTRDSQFCVDDMDDLLDGIRTGSVETDRDNPIASNKVAITALAVSAAIFVLCGLVALRNTAPESPAVVEAATETAPETETEGGRVEYGIVEELEETEATSLAEEEAAGAGKAGGADAPGGREDSGSGAGKSLEP